MIMTCGGVKLRVIEEMGGRLGVWVMTAVLGSNHMDSGWFRHYLDQVLLADAPRKALHHKE
jgi:hypothetical protein